MGQRIPYKRHTAKDAASACLSLYKNEDPHSAILEGSGHVEVHVETSRGCAAAPLPTSLCQHKSHRKE